LETPLGSAKGELMETDKTSQNPHPHQTVLMTLLLPVSSLTLSCPGTVAWVAHSTLHPTRHCSSSSPYRWRRRRSLVRPSPTIEEPQQRGAETGVVEGYMDVLCTELIPNLRSCAG